MPKTAAPAPTSALALDRAEAPEEDEGEDAAALLFECQIQKGG